MKPIILVAVCVLIVFDMNAQERSVSEEEISFDILKWHYATYPKSKENKWTVLNASENFYRVRFEFNGQSYLVEYNDKGVVMHEVIHLKDQIPLSVVHELDVYDKYKINRFLKISDMERDRTVYKLEFKVRSEGHKVLWFDESLIPMVHTDLSRSITDL